MAYDKSLLSAALRALEHERSVRTEMFAERRRTLYAAAPCLRAIDRALTSTAASVMHAALSHGQDPEAAIASIREKNLALQQERACILRTYGLPEDYLTETPLCPLCSDTGTQGTAWCSCVQQRYRALLHEQLSTMLPIKEQNFASFHLEYYSPTPHRLLGISPRENMAYNLDQCRTYAAQFSLQSPNLLLYGSTGLGKTFLSSCIAEAVVARGFSVAYDTAINILSAYETLKFGTGDGAAAAARTARYERADLLIIDDMGTEMGTTFSVSALYNLINTRLMAHRPMVANTNLTPDSLSSKYSPAVASRLLGEFMPLRFFGDDIRLQRHKEKIRGSGCITEH